MAFVTICQKSVEGVLFVDFEFSLTLERVHSSVQGLDGSILGMKAVNVFDAQTWCVG